MRKLGLIVAWIVVLAVAAAMPLAGQGTLSQQVLQLLTRTNSWTGQNTFYDFRLNCGAVPSDTTARLYADGSCVLYWDGSTIAGGGGSTTPHNLLSTTHPDTSPGSPTRGAVVVGDSTPLWAAVLPATGFVQYNGTDTVFSTSLANGTSIPAAELTGILPAISGVNLTSLNASNLGSGTVPLARLSGITNSQIDAAAGIAYTKLALTGNLVNADVNATAGIAYSKLNLTNSIVAGDLTSASVTMAKLAQEGATSNQVIQWNGSAWAPASLASGGSVTSVALSLPGIFTVSGSPVTTTGTLTGTLATQTANTVWAGPTTGAAAAPTFRALVNADFPTSGVAAGTYASLTVNAQGIVTAASATVDVGTQSNGTLPRARGGTGNTASADDTFLMGNGSAWVATSEPACTLFRQYSTTTNLVTCGTSWDTGTLSAASQPLQITSTWSNAGVNFNAFLINVTDTNSTTISTLADWQVGAASKFSVRKDGSVSLTARRVISTSTPSITAGFGTTPAITGTDSAFKVTQGTPVGATGTVTFGTAFTNAPVCVGVDETTAAGNPVVLTTTATTVDVSSGGTMVAADTISVICLGL